ncbi:hypothetical protein ACVWZ3_009350 [Bradyrhizobium sp. i1.3.6]
MPGQSTLRLSPSLIDWKSSDEEVYWAPVEKATLAPSKRL